MSDRVQDLTNHRKVAVACKNYTDKEVKKAKDELITFFSRNTVETDDHTNELAYRITAPSGAKLLQLMSVGGNAVKYNPSVASDSTKAMIKTMPSTVYTFDGSKFYGDSEVSENLLILQDRAETTINGITYRVKDGVLYLNGTATASTRIDLVTDFSLKLSANSYTLANLGDTWNWGNGFYLGSSYYGEDIQFNINVANQTKTFTEEKEIKFVYITITNGASISNKVIKPMLVVGSTAPTTWKQGFSGIHNLELSGLKVEGANKLPINDVAETTIRGITYKVENGKIYAKRTSAYSENNEIVIATFTEMTGSFNLFSNYSNANLYYRTSATRYTSSVNQTLSNVNIDRLSLVFGAEFNQTNYIELTPMFVNGSTVPTEYQPYVQPTTLPIDLTSIEDSGGNKLFADGSLKSAGGVNDELTPYKATKKVLHQIFDGSNDENWLQRSAAYSGSRFSISLDFLCVNETSNILNNRNLTVRNSYSFTYSINYIENVLFVSLGEDMDLTSFKANLQANPLVVNIELATPIEADIDFSQLKNIQGYSNGSITAQNTYDMAVHSEIRYNSIIQETLCPSVTVDGANMWNLTSSDLEIGVISGDGTDGSSTIRMRTKNTSRLFLKAGTYTLSFSVLGQFTWYGYETNISPYSITNGNWQNQGTSITLGQDLFIRFVFRYSDGRTISSVNELTNVMLNEGSTALSYRPYKASITRNLPTQASDGYGVNANAHNLRVFSDYEGNAVNKRYTNVNKGDMGTPTWNYESENTQFIAQMFAGAKISTIDVLNKDYVGAWTGDKTMYISSSSKIVVRDSYYNDGTIFKIANTGNPLYYELADTSKTETDMDDFDYFFDVEEGDIITFNNPYAQQVYATYSFLIKEAKSNE